MSKLKEIFRKNKILFNFLKKVRLLLRIIIISLLKTINIFRKDSCSSCSIRCEEDIMNKNYRYSLMGNDTPICCRTHLYEITKDICIFLNKHQIDYFIMYGTLLGQVRHNQTIIPWDTDVDIVVMKKNEKKVVELLSNQFHKNYNIQKLDKILKVNFSQTNLLHMDIYFCDEKNGYLVDTLNDWWIKNRVKITDIFPLKMSRLYDIDIKIPNNEIKVLKDTYGDDCLEKAYKKYAFKQKDMNSFEDGIIDDKYLEIRE